MLISTFNQKLGVTEGVRDSATGKFLYLAETPNEAIATEEQLKSKDFITPYQHVKHFKIALDNSIAAGKNRVQVCRRLHDGRVFNSRFNEKN